MKILKHIAIAFVAFSFLQSCNTPAKENSVNKNNTTMSTEKIEVMEKTSGTPITNENLVDVLEIQRLTSALTNACDSQQWNVILDILVDEVETTIGEEKGKSSVKNKEEIVKRWKGFYDSAEHLIIHHVTSNDRIFFKDANNAEVFSKGVIIVRNTSAGEFASEGGTLLMRRWVKYEFGVTKVNNRWKVNKVMVEYLVEEAESLKKQ